MKKKWLRRGIYLFTALLLIVAVLGVGLGSHYLSYYGIRPNPFPELKADEIESISVYYDSEYEFTEEEKAEVIRLYNAMEIDWLGYTFDPKRIEDTAMFGVTTDRFEITMKNGDTYFFATYNFDWSDFQKCEILINGEKTKNRSVIFQCDRDGIFALAEKIEKIYIRHRRLVEPDYLIEEYP